MRKPTDKTMLSRMMARLPVIDTILKNPTKKNWKLFETVLYSPAGEDLCEPEPMNDEGDCHLCPFCCSKGYICSSSDSSSIEHGEKIRRLIEFKARTEVLIHSLKQKIAAKTKKDAERRKASHAKKTR